jgi:hypothetical protein
MTITFQGHVEAMSATGMGEIELSIVTPMDPCNGKPFVVRIPADQAKHWIPGRMVSFTLYTLPEQGSAGSSGVPELQKGLTK